MLGAWFLQSGLKDRINLKISVLPVEANPFLGVAYIDDVGKPVETTLRCEAGEATNHSRKRKQILKLEQRLFDISGRVRFNREMECFDKRRAFGF
jgi:hypothetical protein